MNSMHFIRPWALLLFVPLLGLVFYIWRQTTKGNSWNAVCDEHLLPFLLQNDRKTQRSGALLWMSLALALLIVGFSGPSWVKLAVPSFQKVLPRVMILSLSDEMLEADLTPSRLERAKFVIHDILNRKADGQFALIAYTSEAFVVSPLTEDGNTIDTLLSSLNESIMPVQGHQLVPALRQAQNLIKQAGYHQGEVLLLNATLPSPEAEQEAAVIVKQGLHVSSMPMVAEKSLRLQWEPFVKAGNGLLLDATSANASIEQWLTSNNNSPLYDKKMLSDIPLWRDEGRWFVVLGALMLLMVFRRGWLQRIET